LSSGSVKALEAECSESTNGQGRVRKKAGSILKESNYLPQFLSPPSMRPLQEVLWEG
jgi:hypothetical protein